MAENFFSQFIEGTKKEVAGWGEKLKQIGAGVKKGITELGSKTIQGIKGISGLKESIKSVVEKAEIKVGDIANKFFASEAGRQILDTYGPIVYHFYNNYLPFWGEYVAKSFPEEERKIITREGRNTMEKIGFSLIGTGASILSWVGIQKLFGTSFKTIPRWDLMEKKFPKFSNALSFALAKMTRDQLFAPLEATVKERARIFYTELPRTIGYAIGAVEPLRMVQWWTLPIFTGSYVSNLVEGKSKLEAFKNALLETSVFGVFKGTAEAVIPSIAIASKLRAEGKPVNFFDVLKAYFRDPMLELRFNDLKTLGIDKLNPTPNELKDQYYKLAQQFHPDKLGGNTTKMAQINAAYERLSNPDSYRINSSYMKNIWREIKDLWTWLNSPEGRGVALQILQEVPMGLSIRIIPPDGYQKHLKDLVKVGDKIDDILDGKIKMKLPTKGVRIYWKKALGSDYMKIFSKDKNLSSPDEVAAGLGISENELRELLVERRNWRNQVAEISKQWEKELGKKAKPVPTKEDGKIDIEEFEKILKKETKVEPAKPEVKLIPKELEDLAKEASKYKSAEEFILKRYGKLLHSGEENLFSIQTMEESNAEVFRNALKKEGLTEEKIKFLKEELARSEKIINDVKKLRRSGFETIGDFYNFATKGIKEAKPEIKPPEKLFKTPQEAEEAIWGKPPEPPPPKTPKIVPTPEEPELPPQFKNLPKDEKIPQSFIRLLNHPLFSNEYKEYIKDLAVPLPILHQDELIEMAKKEILNKGLKDTIEEIEKYTWIFKNDRTLAKTQIKLWQILLWANREKQWDIAAWASNKFTQLSRGGGEILKATQTAYEYDVVDRFVMGKAKPETFINYVNEEIAKKYNKKLSSETEKFIRDQFLAMRNAKSLSEEEKMIKEIIDRIGQELRWTTNDKIKTWLYGNTISSPGVWMNNMYQNFIAMTVEKPIEDFMTGLVEIAKGGDDRVIGLIRIKGIPSYLKHILLNWTSGVRVLLSGSWKYKPMVGFKEEWNESELWRMIEAARPAPWYLKFHKGILNFFEAQDQFWFPVSVPFIERQILDFWKARGIKETPYIQELAYKYATKEVAGILLKWKLGERARDESALTIIRGMDAALKVVQDYRNKLLEDKSPTMRAIGRTFYPLVLFLQTPGNWWMGGAKYVPFTYIPEIFTHKPLNSKQWGNFITGVILTGIATWMAMNDYLTFAPPADPKKREIWFQRTKPFSFRVPGTKIWVPIFYLGKFGIPFLVVASIKYAFEEGKIRPDDDEKLARLSKVLTNIIRAYLFDAPIEGLSPIFELMGGRRSEENLLQDLRKDIAWRLSAWIPLRSLTAWINKIFDPIEREIKGIKEVILRDIPILSKQLEAYETYWGEAKREWGWLPGGGIRTEDPVLKEIEAELSKEQKLAETASRIASGKEPLSELSKTAQKIFNREPIDEKDIETALKRIEQAKTYVHKERVEVEITARVVDYVAEWLVAHGRKEDAVKMFTGMPTYLLNKVIKIREERLKRKVLPEELPLLKEITGTTEEIPIKELPEFPKISPKAKFYKQYLEEQAKKLTREQMVELVNRLIATGELTDNLAQQIMLLKLQEQGRLPQSIPVK